MTTPEKREHLEDFLPSMLAVVPIFGICHTYALINAISNIFSRYCQSKTTIKRTSVNVPNCIIHYKLMRHFRFLADAPASFVFGDS